MRSKPQKMMDALIPLLERAELIVDHVGVSDGSWGRRDVAVVVSHDGTRLELEIRTEDGSDG